jgi:hypothetical protein
LLFSALFGLLDVNVAHRYYGAYLAFFTDVIKAKGATAAVEEYIFSKKANFEPEGSKKPHPGMFDRFLGGLLHPMIHTGFGLEFGLPGMTAEGNTNLV